MVPPDSWLSLSHTHLKKWSSPGTRLEPEIQPPPLISELLRRREMSRTFVVMFVVLFAAGEVAVYVTADKDDDEIGSSEKHQLMFTSNYGWRDGDSSGTNQGDLGENAWTNENPKPTDDSIVVLRGGLEPAGRQSEVEEGAARLPGIAKQTEKGSHRRKSAPSTKPVGGERISRNPVQKSKGTDGASSNGKQPAVKKLRGRKGLGTSEQREKKKRVGAFMSTMASQIEVLPVPERSAPKVVKTAARGRTTAGGSSGKTVKGAADQRLAAARLNKIRAPVAGSAEANPAKVRAGGSNPGDSKARSSISLAKSAAVDEPNSMTGQDSPNSSGLDVRSGAVGRTPTVSQTITAAGDPGPGAGKATGGETAISTVVPSRVAPVKKIRIPTGRQMTTTGPARKAAPTDLLAPVGSRPSSNEAKGPAAVVGVIGKAKKTPSSGSVLTTNETTAGAKAGIVKTVASQSTIVDYSVPEPAGNLSRRGSAPGGNRAITGRPIAAPLSTGIRTTIRPIVYGSALAESRSTASLKVPASTGNQTDIAGSRSLVPVGSPTTPLKDLSNCSPLQNDAVPSSRLPDLASSRITPKPAETSMGSTR